jgi:hypothetical protein
VRYKNQENSAKMDELEEAKLDKARSNDAALAADNNQFLTHEQVAIYHRIMSEQSIVGQQVYVQYGNNRSEDWFPAAIYLQNSP